MRRSRPARRRADRRFRRLQHGREQAALAVEMVIQGAPADARVVQHHLDRGRLVAVLGEEARPALDEALPRDLSAIDPSIHAPPT